MSTTMSPRPLSGRTAVITGGARGLGLAIARHLADQGADIALLDLLAAGDGSAAALESDFGVRAVFHAVDVTDPASVDEAFDAVVARLGAPGILVNSAGITSGTPAIDITAAEFNRLFAVNVTGTMLACQAFARRVERRDDGFAAIVNVSSMSAYAVNVPQTQAAYNASKAAVSMFTKSVAVEWLPLGIRVNAIAPGYFASDMTRDFVAANPQMATDWVGKIPFGRMGEPDELGPLVGYLVSDAARYVVGQTLVIDGGYTLV